MNTCKNCKYFKRNESKYSWNKYGECESEKILYAYTVKDHIKNWDEKIGRIETPLQETDCLLYMDYESYSASCEVGEDFGCVHFEEG